MPRLAPVTSAVLPFGLSIKELQSVDEVSGWEGLGAACRRPGRGDGWLEELQFPSNRIGLSDSLSRVAQNRIAPSGSPREGGLPTLPLLDKIERRMPGGIPYAALW